MDEEEIKLIDSCKAKKREFKKQNKKQYVILVSCFLLFFLCEAVLNVVLTSYVFDKKAFLANFTVIENGSDATNATCEKTDETLAKIQDEASAEVFYLTIAQTLPSVFVVVFLSIWADVTKKRVVLLRLPCIALALAFALFLVEYYLVLDSFVLLYFEAIVAGLGGGSGTFFTGGVTLIADKVTKEERTASVAILEVTLALSLGVGYISSGYIISSSGYGPILWLVTGAAILATSLTFLVKSPRKTVDTTLGGLLEHFSKTLKLFGCDKYSAIMWLYFVAFGFYSIVHFGQERTLVEYLLTTPLCFSATQIGWALLSTGVSQALGTLIITQLKTKDSYMVYVGIISRAASCFCLAFASSATLIYAAMGLMALQLVPAAVLRSMASKLVSRDEYGLVFAMVQCIMASSQFIGPVTYNAIFSKTLNIFHGTVFIISGILLAIPFILVIISDVLRGRLKKENKAATLFLAEENIKKHKF